MCSAISYMAAGKSSRNNLKKGQSRELKLQIEKDNVLNLGEFERIL